MYFALFVTTLLGAADPVPTSTAGVSLSAYLNDYRQQVNTLVQRQLDVAVAEVEIDRRRFRGTQEVDGNGDLGARLYHFSSSGDLDPLAEVGGTARYVYATDRGAELSVVAQATLPTAVRLGRTVAFGANAAYGLPLLRNFDGREFDFEANVFVHRAEQARASVLAEQLLSCADGAERFVVRYAAVKQQQAYTKLLGEKRRVWRQTAADYRKNMITKLDMLSARSDWIFAQSLAPGFAAREERSYAAFSAFSATARAAELSDPSAAFSAAAGFDPEQHPQVVAIDAQKKSFEQEILLAQEQGKSELDLRLSGGVDRIHDVFDPQGAGADVTDIHGFVGLRFLLPLERPDIAYRVTIARLRLDQLDQQKQDLQRRLQVAWSQSEATRQQEAQAFKLRQDQLRVLRSQIRAAFVQFRDGKLEFQNYLDHWDRYQNAQLDLWERWLALRLAEVAQLGLAPQLPEVCHAFAS